MDWMGAHGGQLAMAFAAGCVSTAAFFIGIGLWLRDFLSRGHAAETAALTAQIVKIDADTKEERRRCDAMEHRLVDRIQQLETILLVHGNSAVRGKLQEQLDDDG